MTWGGVEKVWKSFNRSTSVYIKQIDPHYAFFHITVNGYGSNTLQLSRDFFPASYRNYTFYEPEPVRCNLIIKMDSDGSLNIATEIFPGKIYSTSFIYRLA